MLKSRLKAGQYFHAPLLVKITTPYLKIDSIKFPPLILEVDAPSPLLEVQEEVRIEYLSTDITDLVLTKDTLQSTPETFKFQLKIQGTGNPLFYLPPRLDLGDKASTKVTFLYQKFDDKNEPFIVEKYYQYEVSFYEKGKYRIQLSTKNWNSTSQKLVKTTSNSIQFSATTITNQNEVVPEISNVENDIVLVADLSSSMLAQDFTPNRLGVMKKIMRDFIQQMNKKQRIAIVVFAGEAFILQPLSGDKKELLEAIDQLKVGAMTEGTAINLSLITGLSAFDLNNSAQKNLILFTDGVNTLNELGLPPAQSLAQIACGMGVSIHSIGLGSQGKTRVPIAIKPSGDYVFGWAKVEIDETLLKNISEVTSGSYSRISSMQNSQLTLEELLSNNTKKTDNYPFPYPIVENLLHEIQQQGEAIKEKYLNMEGKN